MMSWSKNSALLDASFVDTGRVLGPDQTNSYIYERILRGDPFLAARFGSGELKACASYYLKTRSSTFERLRGALGGKKIPPFSLEAHSALFSNAGVFPRTHAQLISFCEVTISEASKIDLLGSWLKRESVLRRELRGARLTALRNLEPYYCPNPWSRALSGKKVLVIHPFEETIRRQYFGNREQIFPKTSVLPEFDLVTLKAVQGLDPGTTGFDSWSIALEAMDENIANMDFDVALVGAGAFGLPLAGRIKGRGGIAIHLGGALQLLFGIWGRRWENNPHVVGLRNKYWTRPSELETPARAGEVESGCYW